MAFKVRLFQGAPDFETLHVAKVTCFPLEPRDYKPYSQARICFAADGLHLQLLAFEAEPLPESTVKAVLSLQDGCAPLELTLNAIGEFGVRCGGTPLLAAVHAFTGEDLQGVYWGGNFTVSAALLLKYFPAFRAGKERSFTGNFYKLCEDPRKPHYGCYYEADFAKPLTDPANLGEFVCIDY